MTVGWKESGNVNFLGARNGEPGASVSRKQNGAEESKEKGKEYDKAQKRERNKPASGGSRRVMYRVVRVLRHRACR